MRYRAALVPTVLWSSRLWPPRWRSGARVHDQGGGPIHGQVEPTQSTGLRTRAPEFLDALFEVTQ